MLGYALLFIVIAIIAAVFGFGGLAAGAASIAQILFFIFPVVFSAGGSGTRGSTNRKGRP